MKALEGKNYLTREELNILQQPTRDKNEGQKRRTKTSDDTGRSNNNKPQRVSAGYLTGCWRELQQQRIGELQQQRIGELQQQRIGELQQQRLRDLLSLEFPVVSDVEPSPTTNEGQKRGTKNEIQIAALLLPITLC